MSQDWYYAVDGRQAGPVAETLLKQLIGSGQIRAQDLVWRDGMAEWQSAASVPGLLVPVTGTIPGAPVLPARPESKRVLAGVMGILFGAFGVHKFIIGLTTPAIIMLLISLIGGVVTCGLAYGVMHVIGLVEGIIYLSKSDAEFHQTYIVEQKAWF
jgi:TM2 domain-containing membrane protein YozV